MQLTERTARVCNYADAFMKNFFSFHRIYVNLKLTPLQIEEFHKDLEPILYVTHSVPQDKVTHIAHMTGLLQKYNQEETLKLYGEALERKAVFFTIKFNQ